MDETPRIGYAPAVREQLDALAARHDEVVDRSRGVADLLTEQIRRSGVLLVPDSPATFSEPEIVGNRWRITAHQDTRAFRWRKPSS